MEGWKTKWCDVSCCQTYDTDGSARMLPIGQVLGKHKLLTLFPLRLS